MAILSLLDKQEERFLKEKKLLKGEILFHESDECQKIGVVRQGSLIISSFLENGKQIVYSRLKENDLFGNNLLFSTSPYYKGDVIALQDSIVDLIEKEDLLYLLKNNTEFLKEYLKIQSDNGKNLHLRIRLLSIESAKERLFYLLHENGNELFVPSVSSLARDLQLSRETLSRLLSKLTKEKYIIKEGKHIRLL